MNKHKPNIQKLKLTYEQYKDMNKSIANTQIGKYIIYNQIGKGAFASVYKGMNDESKSIVAIKVLDLEAIQLDPSPKVKQIRKRLCKTQSQLMLLCNSDYVIKCFDVYENKSLKIMMIEFCNGGNLQDQIDRKVRIPEKEAIMILKQIINGIAELHSHNIIHRDLKAENILSHNGTYKIADMGFSKLQEGQNQIIQTTLGTITTMAPEVMNRQPYGLKADIWSIGVIFFQMIFGEAPYRSTNAKQMYAEITQKKILQTQNFVFKNHKASKIVTNFLKQILVVESSKRLGWNELINHPLFINKNEVLSNEFQMQCQLCGPSNPKENEQMLPVKQQIVEQTLVNFNHLGEQGEEIIRITSLQAQNKMNELKYVQDAIYSWVKLTHLQCLKTQLIYNQIILAIEKDKLLSFDDRDVIEFMYLLITRCKNNISIIKDKLQKQSSNKKLIQHLFATIRDLYSKIQNTWNHYSSELTQIENKVSSMIGDWFSKKFQSKVIQQKDNYLVGIQGVYYTKEEQIAFTDSRYTCLILPLLKKNQCQSSKKVINYLNHYCQINNIMKEELKNRTFYEYVQLILQ